MCYRYDSPIRKPTLQYTKYRQLCRGIDATRSFVHDNDPLRAEYRPRETKQLQEWALGVRSATDNKTKIWIQVTSVREALDAVQAAKPDVLVVQGTDAGGHGAAQGAGIISLVPETIDAVKELCTSSSLPLPSFIAAGGISDGRGVAAALTLGAQGVCLGTRYLAASEATIAQGYQGAVLRASDGGSTTIRSSVYDQLRGTTEWPPGYGGRGVINASFRDHEAGLSFDDNKKLWIDGRELGFINKTRPKIQLGRST